MATARMHPPSSDAQERQEPSRLGGEGGGRGGGQTEQRLCKLALLLESHVHRQGREEDKGMGLWEKGRSLELEVSPARPLASCGTVGRSLLFSRLQEDRGANA